jgi:predicted RNase H-like nuclease (RuvC/YqgF family)
MIATIISVIGSSAFASFITWLISRKQTEAQVQKVKAETEKLNLENLQEIVDFYKSTTADLTKEVRLLRLEIATLRRENIQLKSDINKLEKALGKIPA